MNKYQENAFNELNKNITDLIEEYNVIYPKDKISNISLSFNNLNEQELKLKNNTLEYLKKLKIEKIKELLISTLTEELNKENNNFIKKLINL